MTNMNGAIIPPQIKRDKSPALRVSTSVCAASVTASNPGEKPTRADTARDRRLLQLGREVAIQLQSSCKAPATDGVAPCDEGNNDPGTRIDRWAGPHGVVIPSEGGQ